MTFVRYVLEGFSPNLVSWSSSSAAPECYFLTVTFEKLQSVLQLAKNKRSADEVLKDLRSE